MSFLDFCCEDTYNFAIISECSNGYKIDEIYTADGIFINSLGVKNNSFEDIATGDSILYIRPTEQFVIDLNGHLENHYIGFCRFDVPLDDFDWYSIQTVKQGYDRDCCNLEFLKLILKRVEKPMNCEDYL